jgi:phosphomannomutase
MSRLTKNQLSSLFKAYDLRGNMDLLDENVYYLIGKHLVKEILIPQELPLKICIGYDCRLNSKEFAFAFAKGAIDYGAKILNIGLAPSEYLYMACQMENCSGAMITASHNPSHDNGLKLVKKSPQMLGLTTGLEKIRDSVIEEYTTNFEWKKSTDTENLMIKENKFLKDKVVAKIADLIELLGKSKEINQQNKNLTKKIKIVADTANGMGGVIMPLMQNIYSSIEFIPLYWNLDGNYPNHPADPMNISNLIDLKNKIIEEKANLGMAFDGDADRVFFLDDKGNVINMEFLSAVFAEDMTKLALGSEKQNFNPAIVYCQSYSRCVAEKVLSLGGTAIPSIQGHVFMKQNMQTYKAIYGAEASGHHYFGHFGFMDCSTLTIALMFKILANSNFSTKNLLKEYTGYYHVSGERNYKLDISINKLELINNLKKEFSDATINTLDGISVFYSDWKFSLRLSNTEPLIRLNVETKISNNTEEKINKILKICKIQHN